MVMKRIVKPRNKRAKRALEKREPKVFENDKVALIIKTTKTSETVVQAMKDLYSMKKPLVMMYGRKNLIKPFEDATKVEFFCKKHDASLFLLGSHSKKRPHNFVMGRTFDEHVLDMMELGIESFQPMSHFPVSKCTLGSKPCLMFSGEAFDQDHEYQRLKSLFIDFFRGPVVSKVKLSGLDYVISFTAAEGKIYMRVYKILLKKSGSRTPRIELEEMGPSLDFVMRRNKIASDDLYKRSRKQPKEAKPKKTKNMSHDAFGTKHAQIHMEKQDLANLQTRKMKGLKRKQWLSTQEQAENEPVAKQSKPVETEDSD